MSVLLFLLFLVVLVVLVVVVVFVVVVVAAAAVFCCCYHYLLVAVVTITSPASPPAIHHALCFSRHPFDGAQDGTMDHHLGANPQRRRRNHRGYIFKGSIFLCFVRLPEGT